MCIKGGLDLDRLFLLAVFVVLSIKNFEPSQFLPSSKSVLFRPSPCIFLPFLKHTETPHALLHPCSCSLASALSPQAEEIFQGRLGLSSFASL